MKWLLKAPNSNLELINISKNRISLPQELEPKARELMPREQMGLLSTPNQFCARGTEHRDAQA